MEARILLQKIRQRGFTITALGNKLALAPKQLINDQVLFFFQKNKQKLLTALYEEEDEHKKKKNKLGHRLGTLQICLKRCYGNSWKDEPESWLRLNQWLDQILMDWNYDLEGAIAHYRGLAPEPTYICKCGLRPPFCSCGGVQLPGVISCDQCLNFQPDTIGDRSGIGLCKKGIVWTEEGNKRMPLFRYAKRLCHIFTAISPEN